MAHTVHNIAERACANAYAPGPKMARSASSSASRGAAGVDEFLATRREPNQGGDNSKKGGGPSNRRAGMVLPR